MDPKQQQFNFAAFTRLRWPSLPSSDVSQPITFTVAASAIESVFWLGLGGELGAYPEAQTQRLLILSKSLISEIEKDNEDRLKIAIPEIQRLELAELLERGRADHFPDRIEREHRLLPYFHNAVYLSHRMNGDLLGSSFREFLMFAGDREWAEVIGNPVSVDVVSDLLVHRHMPTRQSLESVVAGFFSSVKDMITLSDFFSTLEADDSVSGSKSTLIRRVGRITCWCFDFNLAEVKDRFLETAAVAEAVLHNTSTLAATSVTLDAEAFNDAILMLANRWERFHPKFLTMTA